MALLKTLYLLFEGMGHEVKVFNDPDAACTFFKQQEAFDTLIIDYMLQKSSAEELLERVKGLLPDNCRIVLISGYTERIEKLDLNSLGISTFLPKPLDLHQLCEAVGAGFI